MQPAFSLVWERHQRKLLSELMIEKKGFKGLVIAGDGRADSPGHSAKYGSYSIIDINKNNVVDVDVKLVQVTHGNDFRANLIYKQLIILNCICVLYSVRRSTQ